MIKKIKNKINDKLVVVTQKVNNEKSAKNGIKIGFVFGVGLLVFLSGIFLLISATGKEKMPTKYSEVDTSVMYGVSQLKSGNNADMFLTVVLYSPDCPDCQAVEKKLVSDYYKARKKNKYQNKGYLMLNVKKLSTEQRKSILKIIGRDSDDNKVSIPYVANLEPSEKGYVTTDFSDSGKWSDIERVIERGRGIE